MLPIRTISIQSANEETKGWGKEVQIANHVNGWNQTMPAGYSGKLLIYDKKGAVSSMHYHLVKHETFYVLEGDFLLKYYNPNNADVLVKHLTVGDVVVIPPCNPHQLTCHSERGVIVEFASPDNALDNFRIGKGDSQKA
jgi:quercetin dioxygenase-like cupin family protein